MKPGIKTIISGIIVFLVGTFVIPLLVIIPLIFNGTHAVQFKVPGNLETTVTAAGNYYLWNDFQTVYNGRSYNRSKHIPDGIEIQIKDANGRALQFFSNTSISSNDGGSSKNSIGYVKVEHPGKLEIEISGGSEERIFSFSQSSLLKTFGLILGGIGLSMLICIIGLGLIILGTIKLKKTDKPKSIHPNFARP